MKKWLLSLLVYCLIVSASAQTTFNHQYNFDFPFKVLTSVLPTDSCYYATGVITDTTNNSYKIGNIFIKFDLEGEVEFMKTLTSSQKFYETWWGDLTSTDDGGFVDVGLAKDSTIKGLIIKYNQVGDTIFTKEFFNPYYPDESFMYVAEIRLDSNGNFLVLSGIDRDTSEGNNMEVYFLKFDPSGNMLQSYIIGGPSTETPMTMLLEPEGGILIGSRKSNLGQTSQNFNSRAHIFKLDSIGDNIEWQYRSPSGSLFDIVRDMILTPDGGLVAASGKGIEHAINAGDSQLRWFPYVFKLNTAHEFVWGREFRGTRQSGAFSLVKIVSAADESGYVGVSQIGEDVSIGEEVLGSWLVKVSPQGDSLWARYYSFFDGINTCPQPYDLKNTLDGGYIIVGQTHPKLPEITHQRAWMMKVDQHGCLIPGCHLINNVEEKPEEDITLAIYPNPTSDYLNFQLRYQGAGKVPVYQIIDEQGRVVKTIHGSHPNDTNIMPVWDWPNGIYFLQYLVDNKIVLSEQFIIAH